MAQSIGGPTGGPPASGHQHKAPSAFLLKAINDEKGIIEGYASLYHIEDSDGDVILPGAFDASLRTLGRSDRPLPLLWQHDTTQPIGIWQLVKSDSTGLFVRGQLFIHEVARAAEAYALLRRKALSGLSIGYKVLAATRDRQRGVQLLKGIALYEISLVTFPALEAARVSGVKAHLPGASQPQQPVLVGALQDLTCSIRAAMPASASRSTIKE